MPGVHRGDTTLGAKQKNKSDRRINRDTYSVGWRHAAVFSIAAVLVSLVVWQTARPIQQLAVRFQLIEGEPLSGSKDLRRRVRERLGRSAPGCIVFMRAAQAFGTAATANEESKLIRWLSERAAEDLDNAVYAYLEAGVRLTSPRCPASPEAAFATVDDALTRAVAAGRCTMYDGEELDAWRTELRQEKSRFGDPAVAADNAVAVIRRLRPAVLNTVASKLIELGHKLAVAGQDDQATRALSGARDLCLRIIASSRSEPLIRLCARHLVDANIGLSHLAAHQGDWVATGRFSQAAADARRFLDLYRARLEDQPVDFLTRDRRPALRRQPYLAAMTALLAVGVFVTGALIAAGVALVSVFAYLLARASESGSDSPSVTLPEGRWSWLGIAIAVLAPAMTASVIFLAVPLDSHYIGATRWLSILYGWVALATAAVILATARRIVLPILPADAGRHVWRTITAVLVLAIVLIVLPQWSFFGVNPSQFDASWATHRQIAAAHTILLLAFVAAVVGSVAWLAARLWTARTQRVARSPNPQSAIRNPQSVYWRTVVVTAALGWLMCSSIAVPAARSFNHLERRYANLVYDDLADEVTARMGPRWREAFFLAPSSP